MQYETMTRAEALQVIQAEADSMGLGILETIQFFRANPHEFGSVERCAFNITLRDLHRLLQPIN